MLLFALACAELPTRNLPDLTEVSPAPARMHRLTDAHWRNSVQDLTGVRYEGALPQDYSVYGFTTVGAGEITIAPYDLELYESAAWDVAMAMELDVCEGCEDGWMAEFGSRVLRRPVTGEELEDWRALQVSVEEVGNRDLALEATVAAMLLSPHFLFRVEVGEQHPEREDWRRYTREELAARVSYFVLGSTPDAELLAADLHDDVILEQQVRRLLMTEQARDNLADFFAEFLEMEELELVTKDASLYPQFNASLREEMRQEVRWLFVQTAFEQPTDFRAVLSSNESQVGPGLAALYGTDEGLVTLDRGGILGRAGFLTTQSHSTLTSPTLRGKFVRAKLLCQDIPAPPAGVETELDPLVEGSLRDRLEEHRSNPQCASCHDAMDPIGFALERFDPIGAWRADDNGYAIDTTATIDGVDVDGAAELGAALAEHPAVPGCMSLRTWRYATGSLETTGERPALNHIEDAWVTGGLEFQDLVVEIVLSEGFRNLEPPEANCDRLERCDGLDQDCDGLVDEGVVRSCEATWGAGIQLCEDEVWQDCVGPEAPDEVCDGLDQDDDGAIDEGLDVAVLSVSVTDLEDEHGGCDGSHSPDCNASVNRWCAGHDCWTTGYGPTHDGQVTCYANERIQVIETSYSHLGGFHEGCTEGLSPNCNAAVHRWCRDEMGMTTGFGPLENYYDYFLAACVPNATVLVTSYTTMANYVSTCDGGIERMGAHCNTAILEWCQDQGFTSGFGPLENSGDVLYVGCR